MTEVACALPCHCTNVLAHYAVAQSQTMGCHLQTGGTGSIMVAERSADGEPIAKQHHGRNELKMCKMEIWGPSLLLVPITSGRQGLHVFCNGPAIFPRGKTSGILRDFPATLLCPDPSLEPPSAEHWQPHRESTDHCFHY